LTLAGAANDTFWSVALGMGAVVLVVVAALMLMLLSILKDIEVGAAALIQAASEVSENTAAVAQLGATGPVLEMLSDEAVVHDVYLETQV